MTAPGFEIEGRFVDQDRLDSLLESDDPREVRLRAEELRLSMIQNGLPHDQTMWQKIKGSTALKVGGTAILGAAGGYALGQIPGVPAALGNVGEIVTSPFGYALGGAGVAGAGLIAAEHFINSKPPQMTRKDKRRERVITERIENLRNPSRSSGPDFAGIGESGTRASREESTFQLVNEETPTAPVVEQQGGTYDVHPIHDQDGTQTETRETPRRTRNNRSPRNGGGGRRRGGRRQLGSGGIA